MLSAIFYGLRISLGVGVIATVVALVIGLAMGLTAAYVGGRVESLIMRIVDIQLSFPAILIALILIAVLGQGTGKVIVALITVQWAYYARTVRSAALVEKRKEYIEAAHCLALSPARIVFRHLLPNCLPPMIVVATVQVAAAITLEATLSFLGLGLPITEPSLGLLIANGYQYLLSGKYWISFFPGIALLLHDRQHQPRRRPVARRAESAAAEMSDREAMTDPCSRSTACARISSRGPASSRRSTTSPSPCASGEVLGLVGESGSGKSMTGYSIMGLIDPPGRIVDGSIRARRPRPARRCRAEEHAAAARQPDRDDLPGPDDDAESGPAPSTCRWSRRSSRTRRCRARRRSRASREALVKVGIPSPDERLRAYPHQFSGGMRQRVAIAIALLNNPDLIIADEPTTALDVTIQGQILFEMQKLTRETGAALIWITHDLSVIAGLADRVCVMYAGRIVEQGSVRRRAHAARGIRTRRGCSTRCRRAARGARG